MTRAMKRSRGVEVLRYLGCILTPVVVKLELVKVMHFGEILTSETAFLPISGQDSIPGAGRKAELPSQMDHISQLSILKST